MGRYDALAAWLGTIQVNEVTLTFTELEAIVGPLPASARDHQAWWGNSAGNPQASWVRTGWLAAEVDRAGETVRFRVGDATTRPRVGRVPVLDGTSALLTMVQRAGWSSLEAAVAAHTVFLDPATVAQTGGRAMAPVVRDMVRRGTFGLAPDGRQVLLDDNASPTDAFLWAADRAPGADVQYNHVWARSKDPDSYTALWNLCVTPAFLAKATDTHEGVRELLRYRAVELYGFLPGGEPPPQRPNQYETLSWGPMPPPVGDLEAVFRTRMARAPKRPICEAARRLGWLFSTGPDPTV